MLTNRLRRGRFQLLFENRLRKLEGSIQLQRMGK